MVSSYRLIARIAFEHAYFADGRLRGLHIVPVTACGDLLRRCGLLLRFLDDGFAVFGDENAIERLRLHMADPCKGLGMVFQVFVTDSDFYEYTAPAWPSEHLLFLDTGHAVGTTDGAQALHAAPCVTAGAFVARDDELMGALLGKRSLAPQPAMVIRIALSSRLLDEADDTRRVFHVRFDAAGTR
jgi:hypothetical protein